LEQEGNKNSQTKGNKTRIGFLLMELRCNCKELQRKLKILGHWPSNHCSLLLCLNVAESFLDLWHLLCTQLLVPFSWSPGTQAFLFGFYEDGSYFDDSNNCSTLTFLWRSKLPVYYLLLLPESTLGVSGLLSWYLLSTDHSSSICSLLGYRHSNN
jgi:hypothetical protein